ncbi:DMT family transporter [Nevskia soli]|uniref:DMT family transporter n=1 Tax=Nevskia soli TaxID=418856 RepID=UPI0004A70B06|nr:multidrug efflux SMR transporter [Nevskia soli]
MNTQWLYLGIAIVAEVIATSTMKATQGFSRLGPSLVVAAGYLVAFYFLSLTLRTLPVGVAYAVWSGVGIALVSLIAWLVYGQTLDGPAIVGMALIVAGVVVLNGFSKSVAHWPWAGS